MSNRITIKELEGVCNLLNKLTDSPLEPRVMVDGKRVSQIGNYHLGLAYGRYGIHRMISTGGAISEPIFSGYRPAREAYDLAHAYIRGLGY